MNLKASFVVMSHLSDVQECLSDSNNINKINFAKYIIRECNGDLNTEIDPDEMWEAFLNPIVLVDVDAKDIRAFLSTKMTLVIHDFLMDRKVLSAIKYIVDEAKLQGKRITLKDAKNYIDNL